MTIYNMIIKEIGIRIIRFAKRKSRNHVVKTYKMKSRNRENWRIWYLFKISFEIHGKSYI